ncbi:unnamed protein product [Clavelina lepadiformis]|uniref:Oxysterol-binding protein n=1 Tax=Clavelina lepadiformis TaxID=159417 RepID=A0ABP0F8H5_CLALP
MTGFLEGPLSKWTNVMKGWQYRWFVLDDNAGLLSYYTSKDKMKKGARRGCVRLRDAIIGIDDEDDSTFTITVDHKVFHFQARDAEERKQWASALEDTILRHSHFQIDTLPSPSLGEFDRRLAEADAYLQLLIENVKGIEKKVNGLENETSDKQDMEGILITAQEMIEAVKKSIVLLQLAKTAVVSDVPHRQQLPVSPSGPVHASERTVLTDHQKTSRSTFPEDSAILPPANDSLKYQKEKLDDMTMVNESSKPDEASDDQPPEVRESLPPHMEKTISNDSEEPQSMIIDETKHMPSSVSEPILSQADVAVSSIAPGDVEDVVLEVPATSYSSSEDEGDEFYDANEEVKSIQSIRSKTSIDEGTSPTANGNDATEERLTEAEPKLEEINLKNGDEDDMYMQDESQAEGEEGESVEEHKSVIMHLLSQVKLGMDLTKVVLPTFILERRSLLEMYAEFFSHADYFLEISQKPTPEERMIACLRFYMSTFAAGRDSSVAKKPYNPILGETFQCLWDIPPSTSPSDKLVSDGPVPWAKSDQLSFLAEQVSHHPPVSAFYAEHKDSKMQFNGHIWTKSKFLGLSIGVHNIGQGCIRLMDRDEEYIINFPNGYGRSILTVPWVELGGDCTITCEKTGYNAFVKFHTKPFYATKLHRVTGEVFEPNAKKPFCTMEGEWNAQMFLHYTTGRSECLIDTKKKKKFPKKVRTIKRQDEFESRRLWEKVTINLKANNIDKATEGKRALEDRQRQEAKERLEKSITYYPEHFHLDDCQNWIYKTPLTTRT